MSTWKELLSGIKFISLTQMYVFLMRLDKETLTNVFLGEALVDLVQLLPEDDRTFVYQLYMPYGYEIRWSGLQPK